MDVDPLYCDNATERLAWVENKMWSRLSKYVRKYLKSFMSMKITMERIVKKVHEIKLEVWWRKGRSQNVALTTSDKYM